MRLINKFPQKKYLHGLVSQVPEDFLFTFVTDDITIKKCGNLHRFGGQGQKAKLRSLECGLFREGVSQAVRGVSEEKLLKEPAEPITFFLPLG